MVNDQHIADWVAKCQKIGDDYFAANYPNSPLPRPVLVVMKGKRYARIVRQETDDNGKIITRSAHAFIDLTNGDVLKPDGWKAPAKHARGNLFDEFGGVKHMGVYGPAYLR